MHREMGKLFPKMKELESRLRTAPNEHKDVEVAK
jgi:hypothetical protein